MSFARSLKDRPAISIMNEHKEILFVNDSYLEILGWREQDVIGRSYEQVMEPEEFRKTVEPYDAFLKTKRPYTIDTHVLRCDGKPVHFDARCSVLKAASGDLLIAEMFPVEDQKALPTPAQFRCAELVREVAYELAVMSGRNRLRELTDVLIEASSRAERLISMLALGSSMFGMN